MSSSATRQIARAAGTVMAAFVLNSLMGLLRQMVVTGAFGADASLDAFYAAARLPEILFSLVAGGALGSAFIPTFTGLLENKKRVEAWQLASSIANLVTLVLMAVCALAWAFAPQLVGSILVPEFSAAQQALTVELLRIQLITPVIFGLSGLLMGVLNAHRSFLLPAVAPSLLWLGMIISVFALVPSLGIHGLAVGRETVHFSRGHQFLGDAVARVLQRALEPMQLAETVRVNADGNDGRAGRKILELLKQL